MPRSAPVHKPPLPNGARHRPPEADRQARRTIATNCAAWRGIRHAQLVREPLCRKCREQGHVRAACQVDHIDGDATNNAADNLQSLCTPCHSRKTARENGGFGNRRKATG